MPAFDNDVIGTGAGLFFLGYFLLEIILTLGLGKSEKEPARAEQKESGPAAA
jgi:hypothetical protein